MKSARPWWSQPADGSAWEDGRPLSLTPRGWVASLLPGQTAASVKCLNGGRYPGGSYVCLYEGRGTLEFLWDARVTAEEPGLTRVEVVPRDGILLRITQIDPVDPIRNIRLMPAGFQATHLLEPFHPLFLDRLRPFGILRFMEWQRTNETTQQHWADRPRADDAFQSTAKGVALEYMVDLANRTQADPWFCIPHLATDDYVREFALLVRARLASDRKVYVEYSNEVWNGLFPGAHHAQARGVALALSPDPYEAQIRYYSQRSVEIFRIWETAFAGRTRLVRVVSGQFGNPGIGRTVLEWRDAGVNADALGTNYYMPNPVDLDPDRTAPWTLEELIAEQRRTIPLDRVYLAGEAATAQHYGLELVAFEGGQNLMSWGRSENDPVLTAVFQAANRDPRMYGLYLDHLNMWKELEGGKYVHYTYTGAYTPFGSWGALERQDQDLWTAPKYRALADFRP